MRAMLAPLSRKEENVLIGIGAADGKQEFDSAYTARLHKLNLIERRLGAWRLTPYGKRRRDDLVSPARPPRQSLS
ncbi:MAG: hypothetical protein ACOY4R_29195 [Pseudomonadota bacterium]